MSDLPKNFQERLKRIQVFQLLQQCASEVYGEIESDLIEFKQLELSTKYKARFTAKRGKKREIEAELKKQNLLFVQSLDRYQKTVDSLMSKYDSVATDETNEQIIKIQDFTDKLV